MFTDEFLDCVLEPILYACDPHKNCVCRKTHCVFNLDIPETAKMCDSTAHLKFKWDGVSERVGHYGYTEIVIKKE